jgi:3-phenylpropionate/trans-cinnamate dioxygenase ferredoxin subunit
MTDAVRVCAVTDVTPGTARRVEVGGVPVCLARIGDDFHAIGDVCSHGEFSLSEGPVWVDDCTVECPKHGSAFSLTTGEPTSLPATRPVPVFGVRVEGDDVYVEAP